MILHMILHYQGCMWCRWYFILVLNFESPTCKSNILSKIASSLSDLFSQSNYLAHVSLQFLTSLKLGHCSKLNWPKRVSAVYWLFGTLFYPWGQLAFLLRLWRRWAGGWRWACLPSEWRRLPRPSSGWASVTSLHAHRLVYHPPRLLIAYSEAWP